MRFLYGDSTPFPLGYNFLATLEAFMTAATRIVQLDHQSTAVARKAEEAGNARLKGLDALDQFHNVVMRAVQDTAQKVQHQHALDYAKRVADFASHHVEDHRRAAIAANERDKQQVRSENDQRVAEQRNLLETFLKVARLPVTKTNVSMRLLGEGKDARVQMSAIFDNPDGIQTAFSLGATRVPAWTMPRKLSDVVTGVSLMVGVDKSWLRGTVTPKEVNVDDWIIAQFDSSDEVFDLVLRRKLTEKETMAFRVRRFEAGLSGTVEISSAPPESRQQQLSPTDLQQLDRLWLALRTTLREVLEHKEQLHGVVLDGQPVFDAGLAIPFVVRLVTMFAPTVREIAKRSPSEFEMSLKMETEAGRREEVYLRKETLISSLQPLPAVGREVFAPLGLDAWVPSVTQIPPVVAKKPSHPPNAPPSNPPPVAVSPRPSGPPGLAPPASSSPATQPMQPGGIGHGSNPPPKPPGT